MTSHHGRACLLILVAISVVLRAGCRRGTEMQTGVPETGDGREHSVSLLVLEGPGGSTLALAPVYINDLGPFAFALDTGASHSVIDEQLAEELGLPVVGPPIEMTGVAATAQALQVRVGKWRVGEVELPRRTLACIPLSEPNRRLKLRGLLGSDMLSRFGAITVDYRRQRLSFRNRP
jgi:hypothetical protein